MLRSFVTGLGFVALLGGCSNAGTTTTSPPPAPSVPATTTSVADPSPSTSQVATTTATTSTTPTVVTTTTVASTTTTATEQTDGLVLRGDGLGSVSIGDPMDDGMATLTDLLGIPSGDRVVEAPFGEEGEMGGGTMACWTATGTTCIDYLRVVSWDAVGLFAVFSDWIESDPAGEDWEPAPAPRNLRGYAYFGGPDHLVLATEGGVTIGSTVDDLVEAYGGNLRFSFDQCAFNVAGFEAVAPAGNGGHDGHNSGADWGLWGELSGVPDEAETVVTSIGGGTLLGHC